MMKERFRKIFRRRRRRYLFGSNSPL